MFKTEREKEMDDKKQNELPKKTEKEPETLNEKIMRGIKKHPDRNYVEIWYY